MIRIIIDLFFIIGIFFIFAGAVGMIRMPDIFCRLQSLNNITIMGAIPVLIGATIYGLYIGNIGIAVRTIVIAIVILLTNTSKFHIMSKIAYKSGAKMSENSVCDEYGRDKLNE